LVPEELEMEDKFEREIEDILNKLDRFPTLSPTERARRWLRKRLGSLHGSISTRLSRLSVNSIMLAGIILVFVGFFFRSVLQDLWSYLAITGLALFFLSFAISFFGGGRPAGSRRIYWRGRPASSYYDSGPSIALRLREWWRRRQRRRY
jgi:VIT1/CCC1 family predicted Fe2+/Mn2+ transporter